MAKLFINVFFGLFALCGLAALLYSLWSGYMAHRAQSWPSTTGTVLKAYCYSTPGNTTWTRHVWYQYQVGGKTYSSGREHFGIRIGSRDCVAGYNKGQLVRIYYAPTDPGDAVLGAETRRHRVRRHWHYLWAGLHGLFGSRQLAKPEAQKIKRPLV